MRAHSTPGVAEPNPVVGEIDTFLHDLLRHMAPASHESKPGRPRVLPAVALWGSVLAGVLHGFHSQLDLWRLLSEERL